VNELGKTVYGRGKGELALRQQRRFSSKYVHSRYNMNFALIFGAATSRLSPAS
jgi:hypothetical protein